MQDELFNGMISVEDFQHLVDAIVKAVLKVGQTRDLSEALLIRDELRRLPDLVLTEVLNEVILKLVSIDPILCRWFIVEVFLQDAEPEGRADVAERINMLLADLQSS